MVRISTFVDPPDAARISRRLERLVPGVDTDAFRPRDGGSVRETYGLGDRPVILCAARLVAREGQDALIRALPRVRAAVPDAALLLVGAGPYERGLRRMAAARGVPREVVFAGGHPHAAMPPFFVAADVFALPCRTRRGGLEVEGLGIVCLEAAAAGLPVLAGDSGGEPDAVRDRDAAREMGRKGRDWVRTEWDWDRSYERLAALLA